MGWHDDDFADEDTDPNALIAARGATPVPPGRHADAPQHPSPQQTPTSGYPQHQPHHSTGGYPQQPTHQPTGGYPQQPTHQPTGGYPQQHGGYAPQPQHPTGGYPQQQQHATGRYPQSQEHVGPGQTGGFAQHPPTTGGMPQVAPTTGGFPQQGGASPQSPSKVAKLRAPVVAIEEEAKASRVVFGLSGTAVGGIVGVVLGVLNATFEGQTVTEGLGFIYESAIWSAFILGVLCFWKPERFAYALQRLSGGDEEDADDDAVPPPPA